MSDSRVSRERLGFLDILGNTIDWTIRGFSTPLVGWRRRSIRSSPFHEVGFGSMVFVRFFRFFNRGIIRTTLLATCWWLRHPIWHRSSLFWVEFPMMTSFGEENVPWRADIGKSPPTYGHRDLGAVKWEWTVRNARTRRVFPPMRRGALHPPEEKWKCDKMYFDQPTKGLWCVCGGCFPRKWESSWFWSTWFIIRTRKSSSSVRKISAEWM